MLKIFTHPISNSSGSDTVGPRTVQELQANGIESEHHDLWPEETAERLLRFMTPRFQIRTIRYAVAPYTCRKHARNLGSGNVVMVVGSAVPLDTRCRFEREIKRRNHYVFNLKDDYFSIPKPLWPQMAKVRIPLADLVVVVNEALRERVLSFFPNANVEVFDEPVDVDRVKPLGGLSERPSLVWAGHMASQTELPSIIAPLERVYREVPFTLRIVSGQWTPTNLRLPFPWEWKPYRNDGEASLLSGAWAGLAPLGDSTYARCKGTFKVKVYMAAGLPSVASAVGNHCALIRHGETGYLTRDADDWVDALVRLLRDPQHAYEVGAAARRDVVERFSHENLMPSWAQKLRHHFPWLNRTRSDWS
jgi:glycosyltransferase involved in cell wall biosynthesis